MTPLERFWWQIAGASSQLLLTDLAKATRIFTSTPEQRSAAANLSHNQDCSFGSATTPPLAASSVDDIAGVRPADVMETAVIRDTFLSSVGRRQYCLSVPSNDNGRKRPLLVMLHGCQQGPDDFATGTGMNAIANLYDCAVLYPEQGRGNNHWGCWNWYLQDHQQRGRGEPLLISEMTRFVIEKYRLDSERVYIAGLSAGGAMAAIVACAYPEIFRGVGVHSGLPIGCAQDLPSALRHMKRSAFTRPAITDCAVPIIVFHGAQDEIVHPSNGIAIINQFTGDGRGPGRKRWLKEKGRLHENGRWCTRTRWVDQAGRSAAEFWLVHGTQHAWAGGNVAGTRIDTLGPSASAVMLRFFFDGVG